MLFMLYTIIPQAKLPRNISGMFTYSAGETYAAGDVAVVEFRKRGILGLVVEESKEKNTISLKGDTCKNIKQNINYSQRKRIAE